MEKAGFKSLKCRIRGVVQNYLRQLKLDESKFDVSITMEKSNIVSTTGKIPQQRTKAEVIYYIPKAYEAQLNGFLEMLRQELTAEEYFINQYAKIKDPEQEKLNQMQLIQQVCKQHGVQLLYQKKQFYRYEYHSEDQCLKPNISDKNKVFVEKSPPESISNILNELKEKLQVMDCYNIKWKIGKAGKLNIGEKFFPISEYIKFNQQDEQIVHENGQILMICLWKYENDNIEWMIQLNEMLKLNRKDWGKSVRIVGLTDIRNRQDFDKYLQTVKQLDEIVCYHMAISNSLDLAGQLYSTKRYNYPHCVIIDEMGIIQYKGQSSDQYNFINNLRLGIKNEQQEILPQKPTLKELEQQIQLIQLEQLKQYLVDSKNVFNGFGDEHTFSFTLRFHAYYNTEVGNAQLINAKQFSLEYKVRSDKLEQLHLVLSKIFQFVPKEKFKITETILMIIDVPFPGQQCVVCKGELNDQVSQYYSPFKSEFVCTTCADFEDKTQIGLARYKYTGSLIFINAKIKDFTILKGIDESRIGRNRQIAIGEEGDQKHNLKCHSCEIDIVGPRYNSITSKITKFQEDGDHLFPYERCYDYCHQCIHNQCPDEPLLRILFNNGYWNF